MLMKIILAGLVVGIAVMWQADKGEHCLIAEQKAAIRASRHAVYETISDLEGYSKWHPGLGKIKARDENSKTHLGKEYIETANLPHGETLYSVTVSGHTPPSFFSFTTDSVLESVYEYRLETTKPGVTTITLRVMSRRRSYLFHHVVAIPIRFLYTNQLLQTLYNLKMMFH